MLQNLSLNILNVTEKAAIASLPTVGRGDEKACDAAAVDAMRLAFNSLKLNGRVVIGEGERDEAPMLYIGEKLGCEDGFAVDIALDPLEGTVLVARGEPNAICVIAVTEVGGLLHAPDTYMNKLAVGPRAKGILKIEEPLELTLKKLSQALEKDVKDLVVCTTDRERHHELIKDLREFGCKIKLIREGDVVAAISCCIDEHDIDILLGVGGAPEGVIAAAALKCLGGDFQGQFRWRNEHEKERAQKMGIVDLNKIYRHDDIVSSNNILVSATGVTNGELLRGVSLKDGDFQTHSLLLSSQDKSMRFIDTKIRNL